MANYRFGEIEWRASSHELLRNGKALHIEPKALRVLTYLIMNGHRLVGKDELIQQVWDGLAVTDNALTRIIAHLRRELGDDARCPRYIQTLHTLGYRFISRFDTEIDNNVPDRSVSAARAPQCLRLESASVRSPAVASSPVLLWEPYLHSDSRTSERLSSLRL